MSSEKFEPVNLYDCGNHWGETPERLHKTAKQFVGQETWFETQIDHVIGLNGDEPGKGPGLILDEEQDIHMVWTAGLTGCMGLAILGKNPETGKTEVFFTHARQYEKPDATTDPENPMSMAREFVRSHEEIRVFWGTDFYKGCTPKEGQAARQEAQRKLSTQLGCWVRDNDCVVASDLTFFPKVGLMLPDKPQTAYKELIKDKDLPAKIAFSESKKLDKFIPDPEVESKIRLHLSTIKAARNKWARWVHLDSVRELKIIALTHIVEAYKVGNYDVLRHYAQHAHNQTSPFADPDAKSVWRSQEGTTRKLAEMAHKSAYEIISAMGQNGCGLNKDGEPIASYRHYQPSPKLDPLRI